MLQLSWGRQLLLAIFLVIFGSLVYWLEFSHRPEQERLDEEKKKLFLLREIQIKGITLRDGKKQVTLQCLDLDKKMCKSGDHSRWDLLKPTKLTADKSNANSLVSSLNNIKASEIINLSEETPENQVFLMKEYGLDPESRKSKDARWVKIETVTQGTLVAYLGANHPIGDKIFVASEVDGKVDTTKVYLIPSYFKSNFEHDLTYWRDKKLISLVSSSVREFEIKLPKETVAGVKDGNKWTVFRGKKAKNSGFTGDIENIDNLLSSVTYLAATKFVSESRFGRKAREALNGTSEIVRFRLYTYDKGKDGKEVRRRTQLKLYERKLSQKKSKLYATVSGSDPLYELAPNTKDRVIKTLKDLRLTKLITSLERFTAKRLEFAGKALGEQPLVLQNDGSKWIEPGNEETDLDTKKIQSMLDKLSGNRIKEFLRGKEIPNGEAEGLRITLGDEKQEKKRKLLFWKAKDRLYAKDLLSKRKEAYLVETNIREAIPWKRDFFQKTAVAVPETKPAGKAGANASQEKNGKKS